MLRLLMALIALSAVGHSFCANSPDSVLRGAATVARTNMAAALKLCDQAVTEFPTNARILAARGQLLDRLHRYDEAIRDLSAALKLDDKSAQLWQMRGEVNFRASHFKDSVADFDRVLQFSPERAPYHWQRGISLYYAERFTDGRQQFELHQTVNPNDVENAVWHFLCVARTEGLTNARKAMIRVGPDARAPMTEIYALYGGTGSVDDVFSAATRAMKDPRQHDALFYAHLYLGLYFDALGDRTKAHSHLSKAVNEFSAEHYMGDVARVHFRRIDSTR